MLSEYNAVSAIVRLTLAIVCGGIIGIDRGRKRRPAGFRTHMIVCLGATLTMLISQHLITSGYITDVSRLGAQVVSGIGFLGAGTIIVTGRQKIKGLTTAAGLWASACMGLAIGAGFYIGAVVGFLFMILAMTVFSKIESKLVLVARNMNIYVEYTSGSDVGKMIDALKGLGVKIYDIEVNRGKNADSPYPGCVISVRIPRSLAHSSVMAELVSLDGVRTVEEI
ncbi:MAG: MgtC/SapB family protein [Ruminococcaceae bacterium]|nr:MgtC/SapB family protein [Oscillospiraceae bacterium]